MKRRRLIMVPTGSRPELALEDLFYCMAGTIEDSLLEAGADPGKDYSILDLYKLAQPFALHCFAMEGNNIAFAYAWPKREADACREEDPF